MPRFPIATCSRSWRSCHSGAPGLRPAGRCKHLWTAVRSREIKLDCTSQYGMDVPRCANLSSTRLARQERPHGPERPQRCRQPSRSITADVELASSSTRTGNGRLNGHAFGMHELLHALQAMRIGDFSVRLPSDRTGLEGKIADTFNEIVAANERMASELAHVGQVVGREGKTRTRVKFGLQSGSWARDGGLGQRPDRRPAVADHGGDACDHRGGAGRPAADGAARCRRPAAAGRVPAAGDDRQHDDQAAVGVHLGGDARGARGRHRRQAGRPGAGARGHRRVEGPHRERQLDGVQPDGAGAQHRRRDDRGGERRPVEEDHRGCARRDPAAQGSHQHDGGPVALVRLGGDARGARGGHRGQAGRSGGGAWRGRHLEGPDRQRERDVRQPDRPGAQHRAGHDGGRARRPVAQDHRGCARRDPGAEGDHQHDGRSAQRVRLAR